MKGCKLKIPINLVLTSVCWFLLSAEQLYAQTSAGLEISGTEYTVQKVLNTENGLPANGLSTVMQDSRGYIWAATFNGLVRYDGHRVTVYNADNTPNLDTNRFIHVTEDPKGRIWAGLEYRNMFVIDENGVKVYRIDEEITEANTFITEIFFDQQGRTIIGANSGVYHFENETFRKIEGFPNEVVQQIIDIDGDTYILFEYSLYRLRLDADSQERIFQIDGTDIVYKSGYRVTEFDNVERFWNIYWHGDYFLVVHEHGIVKLQDDGYEVMLYKEDINQSILHGALFYNGFYYTYGAGGLHKLEGLTPGSGQAERLTDIHITDIIFDHEGSLWMSTSANGLIQFVDTPVYQGSRYNFLSHVPITAIFEDNNGTLWVGTNCDGLYQLAGETVTRYGINEGITNSCVWSIAQQKNGRIWAGTWGDGVFYKDPGDGVFTRFSPDIIENVRAILTVFEDSGGNMWFGSFDRGLYRYDGEETVAVKNGKGGHVSAVRMIYEENENLIFATDRGIGFYSNGQITKPEEFDQLNTSNYRVIKKDSEGRFWFGSYGGGLFVYTQGGNVKKITTQNGLFDNTVSQIEFDKNQNAWLAGNMGVFFIEKEQLDAFFAGGSESLRVAQIGVNEGLPIRETTGGFMPSSHINASGELFIPTVQGMAVLQTGNMQLNRQVPNIFIYEIEKDGMIYHPDEITSVSHDVQRLIFRFTALSFKNPANVRFQYRLAGIDSNWQDASGTREAVYTTLSPREYRLVVRASNNDGFWNEEGVSFSFSVPPPYWQTTWFYMLVILLAGGIIIGGYRYRVRNIRRNNALLHKKVAERTRELEKSNRELKELIDEKNKFQRILAHDLRNPFTAILGYIELLKDNYQKENNNENIEIMEMLLDSGQNTLNLLENLLQWSGAAKTSRSLNAEPVDIKELVTEAIRMTEAQSNFKSVEVLSSIKKSVIVKADRNMILTVFRNLISNAIKFSGRGDSVTVSLKEEDAHIVIMVSDNGVGISEQELKRLFLGKGTQNKLGTVGEQGIGMGLQICKEFVTIHEGKIWAESTGDAGSTFYFTLKKVPVFADIQNN